LKTCIFIILPLFVITHQGMTQNPIVDNDYKLGWCLSEVPKYPGGKEKLCEYIVAHTEYPKAAVDSNITGKVFISFLVEKDGSVTNVKVQKGPCALLDSAAVKVVRTLPRWNPGTQNGKPVGVRMVIPINFSIGDSGKPNISQCSEYGK
jgi:TonB family protein